MAMPEADLGQMTPLQRAFEAYRENPYNPTRITEAWQAFLPDLNIPECDWTEKEIRESIRGTRDERHIPMMVPLLPQLQEKDGLVRLGMRYPLMKSSSVQEGTPIESDPFPQGWVKIEASFDTPNVDINEKEAKEFLQSQGRLGMSVQIYILGSQFSKKVTGHYFDEAAYVRLLGSGVVYEAAFFSGGHLLVRQCQNSKYHSSNLGVRSMGAR